jgi:uncharacterized damage-inducible protein DinB
MTIREELLPEFDAEMAATRRMLERLPDDAFDWAPHEKSFTLGGLATHLAQIPHWGRAILERESYDMAGPDGNSRATLKRTRDEVLATFDEHVGAVRTALATRSEAELLAPWSLTRGEHVVMTMPRIVAVRRFLVNHAIHHRGQLSVYLRLRNVPLPPTYGPTADAGM